MCRILAPTLGLVVLASPASGQTIYDTISAGTDGVAFIGDLVLDDLAVDGGGLLQSVTIALTASGGVGTTFTDVSLSIALDGGDGVPDVTGFGDDSFLFTADMSGVEVEYGAVTEVKFDVAPYWSIVPDNALLFGGLQLSNPSVGHVFCGDPVVGATDSIVFSFLNMGPVPVPSVTDPKLTNSDGLAFKLEVVQLPGAAPGSVAGEVVDFELLEEGFHGTSLETGGITFFNAWNGFPPLEDAMVAIDDGTGVWDLNPGMLDFVGGKLLNLNTWSNGPDGYAFAAFKAMHMSTAEGVHTAAKVSVAYVVETIGEQDYSNNQIVLLAMMGAEMVAADTILANNELGVSGGGSFTFGADTLEISGVAFDSLVLFTSGPSPFGAVLMGVDNVIIGEPGCTGDLDGDGTVGAADLAMLLGDWGNNPGSPADLNGDDLVNAADLAVLLGAWGPCP